MNMRKIGKKSVLYIDTSDNRKIMLSLVTDGKKSTLTDSSHTATSQKLLNSIESLFKKNKLTVDAISEIHVNSGPGSFTGLRVGIAVANTLGWLLGIKVNGKREIVEPIY